MGYLSDMVNRRTLIIVVHLLAPFLLTLVYLNSASLPLLILFACFYNPLSIVRANMIDNTADYSKIKLISLSFMIQFFPDTLYYLFVKIPKYDSFLLAQGAILFSLLIGLLFFFDRREARHKEGNPFSKMAFFIPKASNRALFTFLAFIPTQIAYFVSDNLLEVYTLSPLYYSILSFGSLVGASMSSLYKKTPHVAVLTIAYGMSLLISSIPVGAMYIYGYTQLDIPFMFVALGCLLGFYIPFVYDVILHSVEKHFRGTACGILDFVYSGASLVTLMIFGALSRNVSLALVLVFLLFAVSVGLQRASEE